MVAKASEKFDLPADMAAEIFDVHVKTVRRWPADGCPHEKRNGRYYFNEDRCNRWLHETGRKTTPGRPPNPREPVPPEMEGDKDYWLARKYRHQCLEAESKVIDVGDVKSDWGEKITIAKNKFIALGAAVAPQCEGHDAATIQGIIEDRVNGILVELSGTTG